MTDDVQQSALDIAANMIDAGIPIFAAPPCPSGPFAPHDHEGGTRPAPCTRPGHAGGAVEYDLPPKWQLTIPARVWLERWRPGWALAAVGGGLADFLDEDPRNGGDASVGQMAAAGTWPITFGRQGTPSGGRHYVIPALHERKVTGFLPGLDYQGGMPSDGKGGGGQGRGFIWIAPTVKLSKIDGTPRPYVWTTCPDLAALAAASGGEGAGERSLHGVRAALAGWREKRTAAIEPRAGGSVLLGGGMTAREFTETQAREFCNITLRRLAGAEIGHIEEETNAAAVALSHFVPQFWSEDQAFDVLLAALGETAYDPMHPASQWEADKFRAVLVGQRGRAPGDWFAVRAAESRQEAQATVSEDAVSALLAEMLTMDDLAERKPPRYMIKGLLSYNSETWLIGGPGSKKSFVALDMAGHVATGRDWQGMKTNVGLVVMIIAEGGGSAGKRVAAWRKRHGAIDNTRMRALPRPVQAKDLKAWAVLVEACARLRAALDPSMGMFIIVDTQARSTIGLDENKADDMGVYIEAMAALRAATGACVMSVHHTGKVGDSTRGSSALDGAQDTRLLMKSERGSLDAELIIDKQKDIEQRDPVNLRFEKVDIGTDSDGEPMDSLVLLDHDAWESGRFDRDSLKRMDAATLAATTPLAGRVVPEPWTHAHTSHDAGLQRWLLQALADTAEDRGLTETQWRELINEKLGKGKPNATAWRKAFQRVTSNDPKFSEVVVKVQGADRWTVDHLAIKKEEEA